MFDTRIVIWGMDNTLALEDLPGLLNLDYNTPIEYLRDWDVRAHEKTLVNRWTSLNGEEFRTETLEIKGVGINYISAIGLYENQSSQAKAIIDGRLLPRDYRVFNRIVNVVFFELHRRVYCALEVSVSQEGKVRSVLFGQGYKCKKEEWGKVHFKDLPQYSLDSRFFYWMFSKRGQNLNISLEEQTTSTLNILDVSAVSQLSERNVYDNRNEGPDVLGSIPALSGLGINQSVYESGFQLLFNDIQLFCIFTNDCTCNLDSSRSIVAIGERVIPVISEFPRLAITLYTCILPGLLATFHKESDEGKWSVTQEIQQRRTWAFQVIKQLANDNNILLEDIEEVLREDIQEDNAL